MEKPAESPMSRQEAPASVKAAVGLLCLQAAIWALLSADLAYGSDRTTRGGVVLAVLALVTATIAASKLWLAYRLPRGTHRTREAVISLEGVMGCFAGLVLLAALFLGLAGLLLFPPVIVGGIMSVLVANGLTKPPARQYFDANEAARAQTPNRRSRDDGSPAQYRARFATA